MLSFRGCAVIFRADADQKAGAMGMPLGAL